MSRKINIVVMYGALLLALAAIGAITFYAHVWYFKFMLRFVR